MREQRRDAGAGQFDELLLRTGAGIPHRLENPPAPLGDGAIVLPQRAAFVVLKPRGPEHGMGMTVHETGEEHAAHFLGYCPGVRVPELGIGRDRPDPAVLDQHGGVLQHLHLGELAPAASRRPDAAEPSARLTWPACNELPIPTPPPSWNDTHAAPDAVLSSALRMGQSAIASEPSRIASVSRNGDATEPESRWSRPITTGALTAPEWTSSLIA